jgi:hypothetical protein
MRTEKEIISQIKKLKYASQRVGSGFFRLLTNPDAIGDPLGVLGLSAEASALEWALGRVIPVKKVNWYQAAKRARRQPLDKQKKVLTFI